MPLCVYCQASEADTDDHVPAEFFFPPELRHGLIKVPACRGCNQGFQKDDEYLRAVLLLRQDVGEHPVSKPLMDALMRSVARPEARRFGASLLRSFEEAIVRTPAGLIAGTANLMRVNAVRVGEALKRIVRGLHFHETGRPLPKEMVLTAVPDFEFNSAAQDAALPLVKGPLDTVIGGWTFAYTRRPAIDSPDTAIWLLVFYGVAPFLVIVRSSTPPRGAA
jgi:hypothetical protein